MNNMRNLPFVAALCACLFLASCGEELVEPGDSFTGKSFFPMEVDKFITYQVDSTVYDNFSNTVYESSAQVREWVESEFVDNEGRPAFRIARQTRADENTSWDNATTKMTYAVVNDQSVERVVDNLRTLPLTFPVEDNKQWQGNAFIDSQEPELQIYNDWLYRYFGKGLPQTINGNAFDNTVSILQNDYSNLQEYIYSKEIYAENVGLISKELSFLTLESSSLPPLESDPWPGRANTGYTVKWNIIDFN